MKEDQLQQILKPWKETEIKNIVSQRDNKWKNISLQRQISSQCYK